jgi:hypothetical protein
MVEISSTLQSLRQSDTDVARILDVYQEIERVYRSALEAMGVESSIENAVKSSADVTISFHPKDSSHTLTVR